jgi:hypothetical protein
MQSHEVISQDAWRDELRQMIKDELKQDLQFLKVSPIRRMPPKDLSQDKEWIDGKLRLAKWLQIISASFLFVYFVAFLVLVFSKEKLVLESAYSIFSFFSLIILLSTFERWRKIESLLKILRKLT